MRIRAKFEKLDSMKFVGHLDLMRVFQKAMIRAKWPLSYSKGFHPHPLLSFAAPLGVGITSIGEYMDIILEDEITDNRLLGYESTIETRSEQPFMTLLQDAINETLPNGLHVLSIQRMAEEASNAMAALSAASYKVTFKHPACFTDINKQWADFMQQQEIMVTKKTKKGERTFDLKPFIYQQKLCDTKEGISILLEVSTGSKDNLPPLLVMQAFAAFCNIEYSPIDFYLHRIEMFQTTADGFSTLMKMM